MPDANKRAEKNKKWYENQKKLGRCVSCCTAFGCSNKPEEGKTKCDMHLRQGNERAKVRTRELKQAVLDHYGQRCACACGCGATNTRWLTIDHKNNDGADHRKKDKVSTGRMFYA